MVAKKKTKTKQKVVSLFNDTHLDLVNVIFYINHKYYNSYNQTGMMLIISSPHTKSTVCA